MSYRVYRTLFISLLAPLIVSVPAAHAAGNFYLGGVLAASSGSLGNSLKQISYDSGALITDDYPQTKNKAQFKSTFGINGGYEFSGSHWKPALALGFGYYGNMENFGYDGRVIETVEGDGSTHLYNYTYSIKSQRLMAELELRWVLGKVSPFVNVGLGRAFNKVGDYNEVAVTEFGYPPLPPFQSQNKTNFAYQVGLGLSSSFNFTTTNAGIKHERISLGYRYVSLGSLSLGTRGELYPYSLNLGSLKLNEIYIGYTHLF